VPKQRYTKHNRVAYHLSAPRKSNSTNSTPIGARARSMYGVARAFVLDIQTNTSHRTTKSVWPHPVCGRPETDRRNERKRNQIIHTNFFTAEARFSIIYIHSIKCQMLLAIRCKLSYANLHVAIQNIFHVCFMFHVKR
jgi:hypothetical protein